MKQDAENSSTFRYSQFVKFLKMEKVNFTLRFMYQASQQVLAKNNKSEKNRENLFIF